MRDDRPDAQAMTDATVSPANAEISALALGALAAAPVALSIVDGEGATLWHNEAMARLTETDRVAPGLLAAIPGLDDRFVRHVAPLRETAGLSHDERNALHMLLLYTDLLQGQALPATVVGYAAAMAHAAAVLRQEVALADESPGSLRPDGNPAARSQQT